MLPAAVTLQKQGANTGAVTSFMISTPESGIDSIAITYALLDPIMTVARPVVAFITAAVAGVAENLLEKRSSDTQVHPDLTCPVDQCCDGVNCRPEDHRRHHSLAEKLWAGVRYAFTDFWNDLAGWFFFGLLAAGLIAVLIPDEMVKTYLGSGLPAMLFMLAVGIPLYICATASTPIAAALILKGVSPGAALVFLLAGPATNVAALTVMAGIIGKRATAIYLVAIAVSTVVFGLILDQVYSALGVSAQAVVSGAATEIPAWIEVAGALALVLLSLPLFFRKTREALRSWLRYFGRPIAVRPGKRPTSPPDVEPVCGPT
ncbi:MAG: SO_0444 family Cu/Zn efflux transporter [Desulfobacterales bacterium]|nr:SO_0444 family Cu/Zn efflux transporter [Desulfobacterales bacterium]